MSTMPLSGILATARTNLQNQLNTVRTSIQSTRAQIIGSRTLGQSSILAQLRTRSQGMAMFPKMGGTRGTVGVMTRMQGIRTGVQAQGGLVPFIKSKVMPQIGETAPVVGGTPSAPVVQPTVPGTTANFPRGFVIK